MPLGAGYSAEEQLTGEAEYGGLQMLVYPMKAEVFERRFPKREEKFIILLLQRHINSANRFLRWAR
jgi:hypothetical protein